MADAIWNNRFILADPGKNETVIMSTAITKVGGSQNFLEDPNNFKCLDLYIRDIYYNNSMVQRIYRRLDSGPTDNGYSYANLGISTPFPYSGNQILFRASTVAMTRTSVTISSSCQFVIKPGDQTTSSWRADNADSFIVLDKVVGIGRISGGN